MHWNHIGFLAALDAEILFQINVPFLLVSPLFDGGKWHQQKSQHIKLSIRKELLISECT